VSEKIKAGEVRQRLGDLLDRVEESRGEFVIERRGKPLAAIVPFAQYERLQQAAQLEILSAFDRHVRLLNRRQVEQLARDAKRRTAR
jgi:prevent-host-death family protein